MSTTPIIALDTGDSATALALVDQLEGLCDFYKIGGELFTASGPTIVREVRARHAEVFLDLKFHDIPNTVAGAVRGAASLGVRLLTVHAVGGLAMIRAAVEAAGDPSRCAVMAVTVLTSLAGAEVASIWGRPADLAVESEVARLAQLSREAGAAGVVCSGREARMVKERFGGSLRVLIPGVRLPGAATHDQSRTSTPEEAAATGADYVVIGRAVTAAADRRRAMQEIAARLG